MVYTALLNCYAREKDVEKAEATFKKLTNTGVMRSPLVFNILMHLYFQTADSDNEGMDKILEKMESNGEVFPDWNAYCVAADGCLKAGIMEMAMTMLKKLEEKTKSVAFDTLLKSYARKGNKDELYRIWKPDEKRDKIYNKGKLAFDVG
ncbi:pentatricopeptide repeat-containing protein At2g20710, mitochondrial isoform X1 [Populus alba]|uniref:pentatricopeptide repeat-containing protein At2g20710, mitochondrial isoform X1 n=1 Tax=Populus alba TaxID=43335 RepID=UPI003CC6E557